MHPKRLEKRWLRLYRKVLTGPLIYYGKQGNEEMIIRILRGSDGALLRRIIATYYECSLPPLYFLMFTVARKLWVNGHIDVINNFRLQFPNQQFVMDKQDLCRSVGKVGSWAECLHLLNVYMAQPRPSEGWPIFISDMSQLSNKYKNIDSLDPYPLRNPGYIFNMMRGAASRCRWAIYTQLATILPNYVDYLPELNLDNRYSEPDTNIESLCELGQYLGRRNRCTYFWFIYNSEFLPWDHRNLLLTEFYKMTTFRRATSNLRFLVARGLLRGVVNLHLRFPPTPHVIANPSYKRLLDYLQSLSEVISNEGSGSREEDNEEDDGNEDDDRDDGNEDDDRNDGEDDDKDDEGKEKDNEENDGNEDDDRDDGNEDNENGGKEKDNEEDDGEKDNEEDDGNEDDGNDDDDGCVDDDGKKLDFQ